MINIKKRKILSKFINGKKMSSCKFGKYLKKRKKKPSAYVKEKNEEKYTDEGKKNRLTMYI